MLDLAAERGLRGALRGSFEYHVRSPLIALEITPFAWFMTPFQKLRFT